MKMQDHLNLVRCQVIVGMFGRKKEDKSELSFDLSKFEKKTVGDKQE